MLEPKKQKYRKHFRGTIRGKATSGYSLEFGEYGLKSLEKARLTSRQIEAARKVVSHHTKRQAKLWIRLFPDKPVTKKPPGAKMGGGKGDPYGYVAIVKPGRIVFEIGGIEREIAKEALRKAGAKFPFKSKFVEKN
jgi:large subunit ribosomal protein L16